jgi:hypothetical protein
MAVEAVLGPGLELGEVEETGRELGRGAYGVVLELKVKGLR